MVITLGLVYDLFSFPFVISYQQEESENEKIYYYSPYSNNYSQDTMSIGLDEQLKLQGFCDKTEKSNIIKISSRIETTIMENQIRQIFTNELLDYSNPFIKVEIVDCLDQLDILERIK